MDKIHFIGIGASKCGTTWLHKMLSKHPKLELPLARKELSFFNINYNRGINWYHSFFNKNNLIWGEITPSYLVDKKAAQRIKKYGVPKLIIMLREPISRTISAYEMYQRNNFYRKSINHFLRNNKEFTERSCYFQHIKNYLNYFNKEQILFLTSEDVKNNPFTALKTVCDFLNIEFKESYFNDADAKVNVATKPKFPLIYAFMVKGLKFLRFLGLYRIISVIDKKIDLREKLKSKDFKKISVQDLDLDIYINLKKLYYKDIDELNRLGIKTKHWQKKLSDYDLIFTNEKI